jgi:hypothetical protein
MRMENEQITLCISRADNSDLHSHNHVHNKSVDQERRFQSVDSTAQLLSRLYFTCSIHKREETTFTHTLRQGV